MPLNPSGPLTQYRQQIDINEAYIATLDNQLSGAIVSEEQVLRAASFVTQEPGALDTPLQVTFGGGVSVPEFNLDALGNFTCLVSGQYTIRLRLVFGRTGAPSVAITYGRALLNGVQINDSVHALLDDADTAFSATFSGPLPFTAGDVLTFEILRSSAGSNAGGIFSEPSPLAGWAASPSAICLITRNVITLGS